MSVDSAARDYASVLGALFAAGAMAIGVAGLVSRQSRKLWSLWGLELLQVGAVMLPAALGAPWREVVYASLALVCGIELFRCLRAGSVSSMVAVLSTVSLVGGGFSSLWWLARLSFAKLAFAYTLIEINDTVAWAVGSAVGRHKLWPRVSPNKTWEGLLGGVAASMLLSLGLQFLVPEWSLATVVGAGLVLAVAGTVGDLLASAIKRRAQRRTYSRLIPLQGGVFDLYDSVALAAPVWWIYLLMMGSAS